MKSALLIMFIGYFLIAAAIYTYFKLSLDTVGQVLLIVVGVAGVINVIIGAVLIHIGAKKK